MTVSPVNYGSYYPMPTNIKEYPDHYVYTYKDEASTGKKWGVGIASFFLPGIGQGINGQWGKAAGFFGGSVILPSVLMAAGVKNHNPQLSVASWIVALGGTIWSIVDAVKNAKSELKQIVPKEQSINYNA